MSPNRQHSVMEKENYDDHSKPLTSKQSEDSTPNIPGLVAELRLAAVVPANAAISGICTCVELQRRVFLSADVANTCTSAVPASGGYVQCMKSTQQSEPVNYTEGSWMLDVEQLCEFKQEIGAIRPQDVASAVRPMSNCCYRRVLRA